jgi:hypothetical protein
MLFVHRPGRDVARVARTIGAAVVTEDQRDGSVQQKKSRIELVRVSLAILVWFDFAFSDFVAIPLKVSFELGSIHGSILSFEAEV